jgi:23S rRNA (guanosine2251-2'-O)-methyltransferase
MAKPGRPGAGNSKKKGASKGTGGLGRKALEGRGPTPKAEDRSWHVAGKRRPPRSATPRPAARGSRARSRSRT